MTASGQKQNTGGVAVKAMDQTRPFIGIETQKVEHAVEMAPNVGASLHRNTGGLVECDEVLVLVENTCPECSRGLHGMNLGGATNTLVS